MDLTRQPPRRPSNPGMAGIVGLARMTDKARGHNAELEGEYKYGDVSGLDREVLALLGLSADEFAEAADNMWDDELAAWVREHMSCTQEQIDAFNEEQLTREPQDDLHRRLLKERLELYAPGETGITTVYASIELDDWGAFRDVDLTVRPPRTAFLRSVFGIAGAARMADKARAHHGGTLGAYKYGDDSYVDKSILEFLEISASDFAEAAWRNANDTELSEWIAERVQVAPGAVAVLNARLTRHGMADPAWAERFTKRRDEVCPDRPDVTTYYEMMDIDDQVSFGIVDLTRRPPRSPYDTSLGGIHGLARMIDKGRAFNAGYLGAYWFGEDSGFDRRVLEFLDLTPEAFAAGLEEHADDQGVVAWLGDRVDRGEEAVAAFNKALRELTPTTDGSRAFLEGAVRSVDPSRGDVDTFMALTQLDDEIFFARLHAMV